MPTCSVKPNWVPQLVWISIFASGHLYLACSSVFLCPSWGVSHMEMKQKLQQQKYHLSKSDPTASIQSIIRSLSKLFWLNFLCIPLPPVYPCGFVSFTPVELICICSDKLTAEQIYISQRSGPLEAPRLRDVHPDKTPSCAQRSSSHEDAVWHIKDCAVCRVYPLFVFHLRWVIFNY